MADIRWYGDEIVTLIKEAAMSGIHDGAEGILTEALDEAPLLSGTLRRSGTVTDAPSEEAVYIAFNTPYAMRQHEDLTLRHPGGGKAKYLEDPFNRNKDKVIRLANERVDAALQRTR
jgi:hypothetical protein